MALDVVGRAVRVHAAFDLPRLERLDCLAPLYVRTADSVARRAR